ncbi:MAG: IS1182 family transposase [Deltaproteobacteria bacterium]|nr:IS1182 family transposase [Deltaproteobacteria bacterium]
MGKTFRAWDIDQPWLLPPSVRDFVPEGHIAHFIRDTVREELDLSRVLDCYSEERGYPPYHPVMMTALLLYSYCQGVYSSRRIAKACEARVDFMAVTGMSKPDFRTISDFRKRHLQALKGLFIQVLRLCQKAGLVTLGHVALDGTKIKANASKHKAMSYGRMCKAESELRAEIDRWFTRADTDDRTEDDRYGKDRRGDEMPEWVVNKQKRLEKIREAKVALEAEAKEKAQAEGKNGDKPDDKAQKNFTDPESRIMKVGNGFEQCYNAQAAVEADSQIIVSQTLTNAANDKQQFDPMLVEIKKNMGRHAEEISADAGYCSEDNLKKANQRHVNAYVATGRQKHGEAAATGSKTGKIGTRVRAMMIKLKQGGHNSRYRLRKQTVEPVFGQIKQGRGFRQFLMRGREKVAGEWAMVCIAHNLLKLATVSA